MSISMWVRSNNFILFCAQVALISILTLSVAGYLGHFHRYFELASHFKVQYLIGSLVCLAIAAGLRSWPWAACALLCATLNVAAVANWYIPNAKTEGLASEVRLKVVLANVNHNNTEYSTFIDFIRRENPDVLIVQEFDRQWNSHLKVLSGLFPFRGNTPEESGSGIAVFSRNPLEQAETVFLGGENNPSIRARINVDGTIVSLLTIHPPTPIRTDHFRRRNQQLSAASSLVQSLPSPKIFLGDLNTSLWSPYFSSFIKESKLVDARKGFGLLPSWPTFMPFDPLLMIPIDHCLVSADIRVANVRTGSDVGSDHLPLIIDLEIPRNGQRAHANAPTNFGTLQE